MRKKIKFIVTLVMTIFSVGSSYYLLNHNLATYAIVFITLSAILFILTIAFIPREKSDEAEYLSKLKQILKKYDAILAEIGNVPNFEDKNIMLITNIEDMIDAAIEIRKPVYYKKEGNYCIFSLLDNQDMCIYTLKQNEEENTVIDDFINNRKQSIEKNIADSRNHKALLEEQKKIGENMENNNEINKTVSVNEITMNQELMDNISNNIDDQINSIPLEDSELWENISNDIDNQINNIQTETIQANSESFKKIQNDIQKKEENNNQIEDLI